ncbi:BrnA antitoxin family protein [Lamprobacter sp.]|uniref:BrnA antitoxin family protein n=1 Tax=Lamprobacter sp. TaxID=3100796 RepID=UPI003A4D38D6
MNSDGKTQIRLHLDDDILAALRERAATEGRGYQTLLNELLRASLLSDSAPLTEAKLRQVLREMLKAA